VGHGNDYVMGNKIYE